MYRDRILRTMVGAAVLASLCAAVPAAAAAPTGAAPAALQLRQISMTFGPDTTPIKQYHVLCPAGTKIFGGGARIGPAGGGFGNVMISGMEPFSNSFGTGFNVRAMARPGYSTAWSLTVYGMCGPELAGWQLVTSTRQGHGESPILEEKVFCGVGRVVIGMGGMVVFGDRKVSLASLILGNNGQVRTVGQFDRTLGGLTPVFSVRATAVCAFQPPGWNVTTFGDSDIGPGGVSYISSCDTGKILSIGYSRGDIEGDVYMTNAAPVNPTTAQVSGKPRSPDNLWTLWAHLICAT